MFRRRSEYHISTTLSQTFVLAIMGYLSFFFAVDNFTDRIMVTLTTTLVVATVMSSVSEVSFRKCTVLQDGQFVALRNIYFLYQGDKNEVGKRVGGVQ